MAARPSGGLLPAEYRQVEWIASNSYQYIVTDYVPTKWDEISTYVSFGGNTSTTNNCPFSAGTGDYQLVMLKSGETIYWKYFQTGGAASEKNVLVSGQRYELTVTIQAGTANGILSINGKTLSSKAAMELDGASTTLWLFRRRNGSYGMNGSIERFTITNSQLPRLDLIPCIRKSDSKPGMYDTVSKTFYTNAGTGEFTVPA